LRFETEPVPGLREIQPVLDIDGRIAGFFTWESSHPMSDTMARMIPRIAGSGAALVCFAGIAPSQAKRARPEPTAREAQARRAADEDELPGLANHGKTLELLDLAVSERAGEAVTTFAQIELDGMAEVTANLGVLASDELYAAIARRLVESLPAEAGCGR